MVGRTLSLDTTGDRCCRSRIIGVLPPEFEMPLDAADILLPAQMRPARSEIPVLDVLIMVFARLKPDVTPERAELMLAVAVAGDMPTSRRLP